MNRVGTRGVFRNPTGPDRSARLRRGGPDGGEALPIHADATLYGATMLAGQTIDLALAGARQAYLVPVTGILSIDGVMIETRSGAVIRHTGALTLTAVEDSEVLLADLPGD